MERIGDFLRDGVSGKPGDLADLLARSAINRYYYATFLTARSLIEEIAPTQATLAHKNLPEFIKKTLYKSLATLIDKQFKAGALTGSKPEALVSTVRGATKALAGALEEAYPVRVVADYRPHIRVSLEPGGTFLLDGISAATARGWVHKAQQARSTLLRVWRALGG